MPMQSLTVELPEALYKQLEQRAATSKRSIEAELVGVVASVMVGVGELTPELALRLEHMRLLDDQALWKAARSQLSKKALAQLQTLNYKRQREGLSEVEATKANDLLQQYERVILLRSQAARLLKERGQDVSELENAG